MQPPASSTPNQPCGRDEASAIWREAWYAVAFVRDLDPRRPSAFTLLGQDLVLWFDSHTQRWRALADACPHRLVPLSQGRLNGRWELECPYHGWCFDGDGRCTAIPQAAEGGGISARSHGRPFATATGQGLLFVYAGDPAQAEATPLPLLPMLQERGQGWAGGWVVQDTFRDLPMDALTLLENVLDPSHVPFTHHATVGRRSNAGPVELELSDFGAGGFQGVWQEGPRQGKLGTQFTHFLAPGLMWHDLTARGFARILTVVYATPMRRGECRLIARFPFQFASPWPARLLRLRPQWLQHIGNHTVLEDDQVFLHWQERALAQRGGSAEAIRSFHLPTRADRYVQALHDWVNRHAGEPFPGQPLPPRLGLDALMERHEAHTRHCRSCSGAQATLGRLQRLSALVLLAALIAAAVLPTGAWKLAAGLVAVVAAAGWARCRRWITLLRQGSGQPPRNRL